MNVITARLPWGAVPQYAVVVLPQGVHYVVDPRRWPNVVLLCSQENEQYTMIMVCLNDEVTILLPELPDALQFLSAQFAWEEIANGDNP